MATRNRGRSVGLVFASLRRFHYSPAQLNRVVAHRLPFSRAQNLLRIHRTISPDLEIRFLTPPNVLVHQWKSRRTRKSWPFHGPLPFRSTKRDSLSQQTIFVLPDPVCHYPRGDFRLSFSQNSYFGKLFQNGICLIRQRKLRPRRSDWILLTQFILPIITL